MAKFSKGILGGFSGGIGNVVGSSWKGIDYMRSKPTNRKDPKTEAQLAQRMKFSLANALLRKIQAVVKAGFTTGVQRMSAYNRAMSYNLKNAVSGTYPELQIDYASVLIARGDLTPPSGASATADTPGELSLSWTDNSNSGSASPDDYGLIVAYEPLSGRVVSVTEEGPMRQDESYTVFLPDSFNGAAAEVYLAFAAADGREASDSIYLGSVAIPDTV